MLVAVCGSPPTTSWMPPSRNGSPGGKWSSAAARDRREAVALPPVDAAGEVRRLVGRRDVAVEEEGAEHDAAEDGEGEEERVRPGRVGAGGVDERAPRLLRAVRARAGAHRRRGRGSRPRSPRWCGTHQPASSARNPTPESPEFGPRPGSSGGGRPTAPVRSGDGPHPGRGRGDPRRRLARGLVAGTRGPRRSIR